jgi:ubiquinone/menaquinone biosynthesis C-methylase UbiE
VAFIDKKNVLANIKNLKRITLELGCGDRKRIPDAVCIDIIDYDCVDIVGDVCEVLKMFPKQSIDAVFSYHCFEHIENLNLLMNELARVTKHGALIEVVTPHFSNPYFYSDYTHKNLFGLYTFCYFSFDSLFKRKVPKYNRVIVFELMCVDLIFKSSPPFYLRHGFKKIFEKVINISSYTKEFYEEFMCFLLPCYELRYVLRKAK